MPCSNTDHTHKWATMGKLFICRCETKCGFCSPDADRFSTTATLRQHVKDFHIIGETADMPNVKLEEGFRGRTKDNKCPCELYEAGLLGTSPAKRSKSVTKATPVPRKKVREDSQDAATSAALELLESQLDAMVEWAQDEGLTKEVAQRLSLASTACLKKS